MRRAYQSGREELPPVATMSSRKRVQERYTDALWDLSFLSLRVIEMSEEEERECLRGTGSRRVSRGTSLIRNSPPP